MLATGCVAHVCKTRKRSALATPHIHLLGVSIVVAVIIVGVNESLLAAITSISWLMCLACTYICMSVYVLHLIIYCTFVLVVAVSFFCSNMKLQALIAIKLH